MTTLRVTALSLPCTAGDMSEAPTERWPFLRTRAGDPSSASRHLPYVVGEASA